MSEEAEIILNEQYGASSNKRYYVKPIGHSKITIVKKKNFADVSGLLTKIFMPQGFPNSVSKDYVAYQIWDTAQAFCSTITGTLATQEVLRGVGVGEPGATPLAATITWVIKDGCGHLGRIVFAFSHGTYLDAYSKKWRLYADTLNDAAMCIEIALPLFKNYTTIALCVSTVMKSIVGVAGGATRAAMTQHHALRGNLADVSAKDAAQETAVNLVASLAALLIISLFGNSIFIFIPMIILHIVFNYLAVRAVCLRTLNEPRFLQVIDTYLRREMFANPCEVNRTEPIIFYQLGTKLLDLKICGFKIQLGQSMKQLIKDVPHVGGLKGLKQIYSDRNYMVYPSLSKRIMYVYIKDGASVDDVLCSYLHAVLLSIVTCTMNNHELSGFRYSEADKPFGKLCKLLNQMSWCRVEGQANGFACAPSERLLSFFNRIVAREWQSFTIGLRQTGWDLSKHLLIVDEWRICNDFEDEYIQE